MAGIEKLEVHSKVRVPPDPDPNHLVGAVADSEQKQSYVVRWVKVDEGNTLSWSVQPHKKSMWVQSLVSAGRSLTALAQKLWRRQAPRQRRHLSALLGW